MRPIDLVNQYFDAVYLQRNPDAAADFLADPCLRHEHGHLGEMSLRDNIARIGGFLDQAPDLVFDTPLITGNDEYVTVCFGLSFGGRTISGVEVFRVVDDRITETWNSTPQPGSWG